MKKRWLVPLLLVAAFYFSSCAGEAPFTKIQEKEWKLVELRISSSNSPEFSRDPVNFDRTKLKSEGMDDIFILTFSTRAGVSGRAAPDTYTASYEQGAGQSLSLKQVNTTHSDRVIAPERLRETEYFTFLEKINRWEFNQNKLELYSVSPDGKEAVLIFSTD
jgi:hypothetical protein